MDASDIALLLVGFFTIGFLGVCVWSEIRFQRYWDNLERELTKRRSGGI
jgi:hypothetical protein